MKGLTVEEVIEYQCTHPYKKQVYGKWGNLKYQYLKDIGVDWTIVDLPTLLHAPIKLQTSFTMLCMKSYLAMSVSKELETT